MGPEVTLYGKDSALTSQRKYIASFLSPHSSAFLELLTSIRYLHFGEADPDQISFAVSDDWLVAAIVRNFTKTGCGSGMIYSGFGSSYEFLEFPIPFYLSIFVICKKPHLKTNQQEESINYLPFSISHNSPTVLQSRILRHKTYK